MSLQSIWLISHPKKKTNSKSLRQRLSDSSPALQSLYLPPLLPFFLFSFFEAPICRRIAARHPVFNLAPIYFQNWRKVGKILRDSLCNRLLKGCLFCSGAHSIPTQIRRNVPYEKIRAASLTISLLWCKLAYFISIFFIHPETKCIFCFWKHNFTSSCLCPRHFPTKKGRPCCEIHH